MAAYRIGLGVMIHQTVSVMTAPGVIGVSPDPPQRSPQDEDETCRDVVRRTET